MVFNNNHFETASLSPVDPLKGLVYLPKLTNADGTKRQWRPDPRLFKETHPAHNAFMHLGLKVGESIDVEEAIETLVSTKAHKRGGNDSGHLSFRYLLKLMPHHWGAYLPGFTLRQEANFISKLSKVIVIEKGDTSVLSFKDEQAGQLFSLNLPPHYQNKLDEVLINLRANSPGNLKFKWKYQLQTDNSISMTPDRVELHSVLIQQPAESESVDTAYLDRLVGIDLGERGIGFSVRELSAVGEQVASQVIERGFIPIPALKRIDNAFEEYRRKANACAHVRRPFVDYSKLRESTAGHVVAAIKALMVEFKALPVLEASMNRPSAGDGLLKLVYDLIVSEFTFQNLTSSPP